VSVPPCIRTSICRSCNQPSCGGRFLVDSTKRTFDWTLDIQWRVFCLSGLVAGQILMQAGPRASCRSAWQLQTVLLDNQTSAGGMSVVLVGLGNSQQTTIVIQNRQLLLRNDSCRLEPTAVTHLRIFCLLTAGAEAAHDHRLLPGRHL
jgi:hypothetical protein